MRRVSISESLAFFRRVCIALLLWSVGVLPAALGQTYPWTPAAPYPTSVARYAFAQVGEDLYVISGIGNSSAVLNGVRRYNATTNVWTSLADIPVGSQGPAGAFFGGKIYVADGFGGGNLLRIYDVATDTWAAGPARPGGTDGFGAAAGAFNGNVYVVGGGTAGPSTRLSIYNIASNTWSAGPAAPSPYLLGGYAQIGQFLYLIGGYATTTAANSSVSMRLDMSTNTWSTGPVWTPARADFGLAPAGSKLIAMGGDSNGNAAFDASAQVDELDTVAWPGGSWMVSPANLPAPRQGNQAGVFSTGRSGGEIWTTGGLANSFTALSDHLFRPSPAVSNGGSIILAAGPTGTLDPGATVTVALGVRNNGGPDLTCTTAGLTGTLQTTGGVIHSTPSVQNYGVICAGDPLVYRTFTFTINPTLACGSLVTASLAITDGATSYGTLTYTFTTGTLVEDFSEGFDSVIAPALPAGWVATNAQGPAPLWVTSTTTSDTAPNDAFADDPAVISDKRLDSPGIFINSAAARLSFRHKYTLENSFDGGVLEVSSLNINSGAFTDISDAAVGGSFISGGYTTAIRTGFGNPLAGRLAWSGDSGGYISTVANLGPNVVGQTIKLRFRLGSDSSGASAGWRMDTIVVMEPVCTPTFVVTTTSDHDDGVCDAADCTLREAINAANARTGSIIGFAPGVTGAIQLTAALPNLNQNVAVQGPGADRLTVIRSTGGTYRVLTILLPGVFVSVSGLTLAGGIVVDSNGGAIFNSGNLTLTNCAIVSNVASGSGNGGGVYNLPGATLEMSGCTVSGNSAGQFGGGVYNDGTFFATNCTFSSDTALRGGGIISRFNNGAATVDLRNCTITGCRATDGLSTPGSGGGGLYAEGGSQQHHVGNSILANNVSTNDADVRGSYTSSGHNLIGKVGDSAGFTNGVNGDQVGSGTGINPQFDPAGLANNGGPTPTIGLLANSPAINNGGVAHAPARDQRGYQRAGPSDIGAFEFNGGVLRLVDIARNFNDIVLTIEVVRGKTYRLERKLNMTDATWLSIGGVADLIASGDDTEQITDPNAVGLGQAFYHVISIP